MIKCSYKLSFRHIAIFLNVNNLQFTVNTFKYCNLKTNVSLTDCCFFKKHDHLLKVNHYRKMRTTENCILLLIPQTPEEFY